MRSFGTDSSSEVLSIAKYETKERTNRLCRDGTAHSCVNRGPTRHRAALSGVYFCSKSFALTLAPRVNVCTEAVKTNGDMKRCV